MWGGPPGPRPTPRRLRFESAGRAGPRGPARTRASAPPALYHTNHRDGRLAQLVAVARDRHAHRFRVVAVQRENLPYEIADLFGSALIEHQNRRAGAAERASQ